MNMGKLYQRQVKVHFRDNFKFMNLHGDKCWDIFRNIAQNNSKLSHLVHLFLSIQEAQNYENVEESKSKLHEVVLEYRFKSLKLKKQMRNLIK